MLLPMLTALSTIFICAAPALAFDAGHPIQNKRFRNAISAAASQNLASIFWDQDPKIVELLLEKRLRCLQRYFPSRRLDILQTMADLASFKCRLCKLDEATQLCSIVLSQPTDETFTYRALKADVYEQLGAICVTKKQYHIADVCFANAASFYSSRGPFDPYFCSLIDRQIYAKYHSGNYTLAFQMAHQLEISLKSQKGLWRDDLLESAIRKQCICAFWLNRLELCLLLNMRLTEIESSNAKAKRVLSPKVNGFATGWKL